MGFFGKGSLSRSEPNWLDKEKRRLGLLAKETSEEVTRKRRQERKEFKNERARKEREAIEEKLLKEGKLGAMADALSGGNQASATASPGRSVNQLVSADAAMLVPDNEPDISRTVDGKDSKPMGTFTARDQPIDQVSADIHTASLASEEPVSDLEHLQLTQEEALFLVYGLGVLDVVDEATEAVVPVSSLLPLFRRQSCFPPLEGPSLLLDDPFMLSYVVYHHFRSLGWVVRPGMKFAVDYLLYNRGPVFAHAEFAVVIVPSYEDPYYAKPESRRDVTTSRRSKDWWWLHCVNRVQAQVHKNLVLVFVEIPAPISEDQEPGLTELLKRYKIREFSLKRWTPNRGRD
jgi:tRNA-splicing endonuclease subunit Sen2